MPALPVITTRKSRMNTFGVKRGYVRIGKRSSGSEEELTTEARAPIAL